jgi:hypothetical protein
MPTLADVLKSAGVKDEVISGLPPDVVSAVNGYVSQADTTLQTAAQKEAAAQEALRQAALEKKDINDYVETYGNSLTKTASVEAENKALKTYLESLKTQGFDIQLPAASSSAAVVPGSPAMGANAVDANKIMETVRGQVGSVMSQFLDANNEHIRLYGVPIPDASTDVAAQAAQARKPIGQFLAEKYKFADKRKEQEASARQKEIDSQVKQRLDEEHRKEAEARASNPNLRAGETSRSSVLPIKHDDFQKSSGMVPRRERMGRMLENIHKDVAASRQSA